MRCRLISYRTEHKAKYFNVLKLCNIYFSESIIEIVCRTAGIEMLMEYMNDDIVSEQGLLYPHQFMYDIVLIQLQSHTS